MATSVVRESCAGNYDFSFIASLVNIQGNEISDALAKAGADDASVPSAPLTYLELFSRAKSRLTAADATKQLLLASLVESLTFSDNSECFEICPKCTAEQATPDHILACLGLSKRDLVPNPLLTLHFFRVILHGPDIARLTFGDHHQQHHDNNMTFHRSCHQWYYIYAHHHVLL
ncbi:hypothetical protein AVEN_92971-1 [Araneus ventricosus]|uniref:RNase H type-1 domain-containing protein n=1 Tax=Araneus ventricosus TaxID=182803 RepID=A0A4Y2VLH2_ARAVE|nr:hypothetical protein AVEN_92971-1 [Araneus ventricosus]